MGKDKVRVTSLHLQNRSGNTATRQLQLTTLLADLDRAGATGRARIVAGDLNAVPGSPEIALLTRAGFVSAVDAVGDPAALTSPGVVPRSRIDWVFGRGVAFSRAEVLTEALTSDHLPLVVVRAP
jgi:endonuclease/exonuclease/phosphatase family metal-dependent hydrolase